MRHLIIGLAALPAIGAATVAVLSALGTRSPGGARSVRQGGHRRRPPV